MPLQIDDRYAREFCAIQELMTRYFQAVDRGDVVQVRGCLADDARVALPEREAIAGGDAVVDAIFRPAFAYLKEDTARCRTHFMGNFRIERLEGDLAETETYVIAVRVMGEAAGDIADVMSLRYLDRLRRVDGQWRISERRMTRDWSCRLPTSFAMPFARRVVAI
jgi:ketosteroid isomerase-like protein